MVIPGGTGPSWGVPAAVRPPSTWSAVVAETVRTYARRPLLYAGLALALQGLPYLLLALLSARIWDTLRAAPVLTDPDAALCQVLVASVPVIGSSLGSGVLYILLAATAAVPVLLGDRPGATSAMGMLAITASRLQPLLGGTLLAVVIVGVVLAVPLGALALMQGCLGQDAAEAIAPLKQAAEEFGRTTFGRVLIWLAVLLAMGYVVNAAVKWIVLPQVALVEGRRSPTALLWRSRQLVYGRWWTVAGILLALLVLQSAFSTLLGIPFSVLAALAPPGLRDGIRLLGAALAQVLALPIGALGSTFIYLYLIQSRNQ